jgi:putative redox protein
MLLAGLGCCTALVLHTYAHNHGVHLHEVELRVTYERTFASDCQDCEGDTPNEESIRQEVVLIGPLSETDRRKLLRVAGYCPIHKMLANGIRVITRLAEGGKQASADGVPDEYHPR